MPKEIEVKLRTDNLENISKKLIMLGAYPIGKYTETDTFYDTPEGDLRKRDSALRIRTQKSHANPAEVVYLLTYKGKRLESPYKVREEIELKIEDSQKMDSILRTIGFVPIITYSKTRTRWQLNECFIELDSLVDLGNFVEIEGPSEDAIKRILKLLSLEKAPKINKTYLEMVMQKLG